MAQTTLALILSTVIITISAIIFLTYILNDVFTDVWKKRFETSIKNGIEKNKIQNTDIYILAERWPIGKTNIQHCLNNIFYYYINTADQDIFKLEKVREIIDWHKKQDPFSELPENIRLQLTTLQNLSDGNKEIVLQLSKSLSELYSSKEKSLRSDKRITRISLLLAVIGVAYPIISPYITMS
ncbi:hypothetical protein [Salmonella enterica]|uniref:hypothetical protein n=1 Tax=Salmonella enterica TaxID=28901 RepID=UPI00127FF4EC|nr:hypothetical protein [Salmonella enterica subsp. enterica serovar Pasing]EBX5569144.1 hypothetical protein [Salmonella enterica subsp. enterica serovar Kuessel]ECI5564333.1 hypothetical protein [Salmonella enterica subsp. enterica]EDW1640645.1 hypothetical protein [Salmonella enterica subsp. enterica serovar Baguida]EDW2259827.1 hypothetical protein [Salmonella enterica subsp. enterica serovar Langford]